MIRATTVTGLAMSAARSFLYALTPKIDFFLMTIILFAGTAGAEKLQVMRMGLGSGTITATGISCPADCDENFFASETVMVLASASVGSTFVRWEGDVTGLDTANPMPVTMDMDRSLRAVFNLTDAIPPLPGFTPEAIRDYLNVTMTPSAAHVNTPARFLKALPGQFTNNWLLMTRSESLQTGTAESPRLILPSADAKAVFTIGMVPHVSYPGSHPNAIEYMQWDATDKNFRFHEIVLANIPNMGEEFTLPNGGGSGIFSIPARSRAIYIDDAKCFKCHSTRNVLNTSPQQYPGTTGVTPGTVPWKNKPNWDSYDSWAGLMPFNRDRIYQGSVEAAAFRKFFNLWTWSANDPIREIIEQLGLQPPLITAVAADDGITRTVGGPNDGHINFAFDISPPVFVEPAPAGSATSINTAYAFGGAPSAGTPVTRGGEYVLLRHTDDTTTTGLDVEGRGVQLFDRLGGLDGGLDGSPNQQRVADEVIRHRFATGSFPIDVRPIALAIAQGWIAYNQSGNNVVSTIGPVLSVDFSFFNSRHGVANITALVNDTRTRAQSMPHRKADRQKKNLDRVGDEYLAPGSPADGLILEYGAMTHVSQGTSVLPVRLRQEVFRRHKTGAELGAYDSGGTMGGIYVDREKYDPPLSGEPPGNTEKMALFRYFLEPLGVSVDKWSMSVRGRSRTYTFADIFQKYLDRLKIDLTSSLQDPTDLIPGLGSPNSGSDVINYLNSSLISSKLPGVADCPTYTDVQRIFNKSCIECHGGLLYPPYRNYLSPTLTLNDPNDPANASHFDLSEDENPPSIGGVSPRLARSYGQAAFRANNGTSSSLYLRLISTSEDCPFGGMPCGGPALSKVDIETIRRWIVCPCIGTECPPFTVGDTHIRTVNGVNYDFQAAGEFVLLRDEYIEIQARQTAVGTDGPLGPNPHTGLTTCVSVNSAIAIRIGIDRITYQPNINGQIDPAGLQLRINGQLVTLTSQPIPLASGGRIVRSTAPGGIQVEAPGGSVIVITPGFWNHYQLWYLNVDVRGVRATAGLMGVIAPGNWLPALPDGTPMGPMPAGLPQRYQNLYNVFGNAWRVTHATTLFDYAPGNSTATFTIGYWPSGVSNQVCIPPPQPNMTNRPPPARLPLAVAEQACSGVLDPDQRANCVQDVMATGDTGFATTYLRASQIATNAIPQAPPLLVPVDFPTNGLGQPITFTWNRAIDQNGDPISYKLYIWLSGQTPNNNNAEPVSSLDQLSIRLTNGLAVIEWAGTGAQLESAVSVTGPWANITNAVSPHLVIPNAASRFYRLRGSEQVSKTVSGLVSGQLYYWKVIAEDGKGGTVESETRGFQVE